MSLRETHETIGGFFGTKLTEGEVLYRSVKKSVTNLILQLRDIVGECFDGAANMSDCKRHSVADERMFTTCSVCPLLCLFS